MVFGFKISKAELTFKKELSGLKNKKSYLSIYKKLVIGIQNMIKVQVTDYLQVKKVPK